MPPIILIEEPPVFGLPFARTATLALPDERDLVEHRLRLSEERAAWECVKAIGDLLAA